MRRRSYEIYRDDDAIWWLVFDESNWRVEKSGNGAPRSRLTIEEFETSPDGERLRGFLARALNEAEMDL